MKHILSCIGLSVILLAACGPAKNTTETQTTTTPNFTFSVVEESDPSYGNLPALQSFVFGSQDGNWIMFAGRTNGFHGFAADSNTNFPVKKANNLIYVFDSKAKQLYSMPIPQYGGDTGYVFLLTNLAHTQNDNFLYACGGYGGSNGSTDANKTYSYFMRVSLSDAIDAVKANTPANFKKAVVWGSSHMVASTGGELYQLPDGKFYMSVGHNYTGTYGSSNPIQKYVDKVYVFDLTVNGMGSPNNLALIPVDSITDGLPDSTTQFRRRDLVVAPNVLANGSDIGLAIYGGVFTPGNNATPYHNPIYIDRSQSSKYKLDPFVQWTNIYSTAFMTMYDTTSKTMMTSLFGGIGDSINNSSAWANANWTNVISTNMRSYVNGDVTTSLQNPSSLPGFVGSESVFIPTVDAGLFYNSKYKIMDYSKLTSGQVVGYIYGGIISNQCCSDSHGSTVASNKIYKVTITKN